MIKNFIGYYRPYRKLFILDFTCAVFAALLELAFPLAVNRVIDTLLPSQNWTMIVTAVVALFAFYIINSFMQYIVTFWGHILGLNIESDMRRDLYEHLQTQSFDYYDNQRTGKLMSRMTNDLFEIGEVAHHGPEDVFIAIMTIIGTFLIMMRIHVELAIATVILVPLIAFLIVYFNKRMTGVNSKIFKSLANFNAGLENAIGGIRVVKAFANEDYERKRFGVINDGYKYAKTAFYRTMAKSSSINYLLIRLMTLFTLLMGSYYSINGAMTNGEFVAFILLANVLVRPIEKINAVIESYPKGIAGFKRFTETMNQAPTIVDAEDAIEAPALTGNIVYDHVTFGYEGSKTVLNNIDLTIKNGETIAFVGPSGAGKTTLCSLLPRFYDVKEGTIRVDDIDIRKLTLHSLRKNIGIVQQDVYLFSGTVRENIAYGRLDATDDEIWHVARLANLEEVINNMTDGIDTIIGERGVKLSGGQKQRLAIARMFLKNPPILILDEATSALDTETERIIQTSLDKLTEGRTTLIIAHRLATIRNADRIIVINESGIAEQGTHEQLIANAGPYKALHDAQFRD
ncbi:ABC transporter ATP-binding protein [Brochothrix thermosphacta]|uniref:Putative ABC lipid transporter (ATP-binding protein) n=1 Tax=Brochothrix thermosphacta TaxID=2756 RepID=A0A2X0S8B6_BROTH|nr:ABC transporter ATP-binding protein [Brochothrix thermosphacta]SPP28221.1 putative ABC lipid transporter (ATP-binding protein) [Brochothrix thermosphacta]